MIYNSEEGGATLCVKAENITNITQIPPKKNITYVTEIDTSCPDFSILNKTDNKCNLLDVLHNKKHMLLFNLKELHKGFSRICNESSEICYKNFIGPINDHKNHDLFFISFNEREKINVQDFSYILDTSSPIKESGYLFGLFNNRNTKNIDDTDNIIKIDNIKILKNLGTKLDKVLLIPGIPYTHNISYGIMLNYKNGDICLDDPSKNYTSYLFISCAKFGYYTSPKYLGKVNNNCTYIFEWENRYGCPVCLRKNTTEYPVNYFLNCFKLRWPVSMECRKSDMKKIIIVL